MPALRTSLLALVCAVSTGAHGQTIQVDTDFGDQGWMDTGFSGGTRDLQLMQDHAGRLVHLHTWQFLHPSAYLRFGRTSVDGVPDPLLPYSQLLPTPTRTVAEQPLGVLLEDDENRLVLFGSMTRASLGRMAFMSRVFEDGRPDTTLNHSGTVTLDLLSAVEVWTALRDGNRFLVALGSPNPNDNCSIIAVRADGRIDNSFRLRGSVSGFRFSTRCTGILPRGDGFIAVGGGYSGGQTLVAFDSNGNLDFTFGFAGTTNFGVSGGDFYPSILSAWGERFVVAGTYAEGEVDGLAVFVFDADGNLDTSFNGGASVFFEPTVGKPSGHDGVGAPFGKVGLSLVDDNLVATVSTQLDSVAYGLNFIAFDASGTQIDLGGPLGFHVEPVTRYYTQHLPQYYSSTGAVIVNDNRLVVSGTTRTASLGVSRLDAYRLTGFPVSSAPPAEPERLDLVVTPSPTSRSARATLTLPQPQRVRIAIVDMLGRTVLSVADHETPAGTHTVPLDVSRLAPGAYVVVAETGTTRQTARLSVVR